MIKVVGKIDLKESNKIDISNIRHDVYCEVDFLEKFADMPAFDINDSKFNQWKDYYHLLTNDTNLKIDGFKENEFKKNKVLLTILKSHNDGRICIRELDQNKENKFGNKYLEEYNTQVNFLAEEEKCRKLNAETGLMFVSNSSMYKKHSILFRNKPIPISDRAQKNHKDWSFLNEFWVQSNFLMIADPYIFKYMQNNLYQIIDLLLPTELSQSFHLTIIGRPESDDLNEFYNKIKTYLKSKNRNFDIKLRIAKDSKNAIHDRVILSNMYLLEIGAGFKLFRKNKTTMNNTVLRIISPFCNIDERGTYCVRLSECQHVIDTTKVEKDKNWEAI